MKEFDLNGVVVSNDDAWIYDWYELEHTSPQKVKSFLAEANGEDVIININSGGGDLYSGVNIHDMIKNYSGNIELRVSGIAASAASVIAMAGKCLMSPASVIMIHNSACADYGNKCDKTKCAADLGVHDKGIAELYAAKTGIDTAEIMRMMDKETFLDAKTAFEMKFIDGIITDSAPRISNSLNGGLLPQTVIDEVRRMRTAKEAEEKKTAEPDGVSVEQLKKRLLLLRR